MLKAMRKHAKFFYVLFVIVILSFIFWGVGSVDKTSAPSVAEIGKDKITAEEYWRAYERARANFRDIYKDKFNEEMEKKLNLKQAVLDSMLTDRLLTTAAEDLGMSVSDRELQDVITHEPAFMRDGVFRQDVYFRSLQLRHETPETFESSLRQQILSARMRQLIWSSAEANPLDLKDIQGDDKAVNEKLQAVVMKNRNITIDSYVSGMSLLLHVKINTELIS